MRRRFALAWHVLRGRSIIYGCAFALTDRRLFIGTTHPDGRLTIEDNSCADALTGPAEIAVADFDLQTFYALRIEDRTP